MNSFGTGGASGTQDSLTNEIAFRRGRRPDADGFIRHLDVKRAAVGLGKNSHTADVHLAESANDANGDFASIGDQNFAEQA